MAVWSRLGFSRKLFAAYDNSNTVIRFQPERPLDPTIIEKLVLARIEEIDAKSDNAVLRYRNDLTPELSLGWISTLRQAEDYHNFVHGLDAKYQWNDQNKLIAQVLRSDSEYPATLAAQLAGEAAFIRAYHYFNLVRLFGGVFLLGVCCFFICWVGSVFLSKRFFFLPDFLLRHKILYGFFN